MPPMNEKGECMTFYYLRVAIIFTASLVANFQIHAQSQECSGGGSFELEDILYDDACAGQACSRSTQNPNSQGQCPEGYVKKTVFNCNYGQSQLCYRCSGTCPAGGACSLTSTQIQCPGDGPRITIWVCECPKLVVDWSRKNWWAIESSNLWMQCTLEYTSTEVEFFFSPCPSVRK